jgi:hypothetical protein
MIRELCTVDGCVFRGGKEVKNFVMQSLEHKDRNFTFLGGRTARQFPDWCQGVGRRAAQRSDQGMYSETFITQQGWYRMFTVSWVINLSVFGGENAWQVTGTSKEYMHVQPCTDLCVLEKMIPWNLPAAHYSPIPRGGWVAEMRGLHKGYRPQRAPDEEVPSERSIWCRCIHEQAACSTLQRNALPSTWLYVYSLSTLTVHV